MPVGAHLHSVEIVHLPPSRRECRRRRGRRAAARRRRCCAARSRRASRASVRGEGDDSQMTHLGDPTKGDAARAAIGEHVRVLRREGGFAAAAGALRPPGARARRGVVQAGAAPGAGTLPQLALIQLDDALRDAQTAAQVLVVDKRRRRPSARRRRRGGRARRGARRSGLEAQVAAKNAEAAPKPTAAELRWRRARDGSRRTGGGSAQEPAEEKMGRSGLGRAAKAVEEAPAPAAAPPPTKSPARQPSLSMLVPPGVSAPPGGRSLAQRPAAELGGTEKQWDREELKATDDMST